jgi:asparaginyl-tRNA synthetase
VYCFGPTFRAEKSKTRRHLTEFWMVEPEVAFAELNDIMDLAEDLVCFVLEAVLGRHAEELESLGRCLKPLRAVQRPFPRITYDQAADILRSATTRRMLEEEMAADRGRLQEWADELAGLERKLASVKQPGQRDAILDRMAVLREELRGLEQDLAAKPEHLRLAQAFEWGRDLGGSDETILARCFGQPVFVREYPREAKAFYMKRSSANPRVVLNMDLLAPEGYGEIIGGSQREDDLERLKEAMTEKGLKPEDYAWYLDLRRYGSVPHGGFGLGVERMLAWICGLQHVRETIPFPRTLGRMAP